jgi:hypothetical protein
MSDFDEDFWEQFDAELESVAERKRVAPVAVTVSVLVKEKVLDLKFYEGDPRDWAHATAANPQRLDVQLDLTYGYNIHGAVESMAVTSGRLVVAGVESEITAKRWKKLFDGFSGRDIGAVTDAVWGLNEFHPSQRLAKAKKALAGVQGRKRS